jgi:hypothetical protein
LRNLAALAGLSLAAACQAAPSAPTPAPAASQPPAAGLSLVLANSELVVGPNHLAYALLEDGKPLVAPRARTELFQIDGQTATRRAEAEAVYRSIDGVRGLFTVSVYFDRAGTWGLQSSLAKAGGGQAVVRSALQVVARGAAPMIGARAPASRNPTASQVANLSEICSAQPPCGLHQLSVADAFAQGRPSMIAFATPGFCTSQTCAPVLGELLKVSQRFGDRISFVHVEIYKEPRTLTLADAVVEWGLQSEPWIFAVDRDGVIADRLESLVAAEELEQVATQLLSPAGSAASASTP